MVRDAAPPFALHLGEGDALDVGHEAILDGGRLHGDGGFARGEGKVAEFKFLVVTPVSGGFYKGPLDRGIAREYLGGCAGELGGDGIVDLYAVIAGIGDIDGPHDGVIDAGPIADIAAIFENDTFATTIGKNGALCLEDEGRSGACDKLVLGGCGCGGGIGFGGACGGGTRDGDEGQCDGAGHKDTDFFHGGLLGSRADALAVMWRLLSPVEMVGADCRICQVKCDL